jgi:hypothetical protein
MSAQSLAPQSELAARDLRGLTLAWQRFETENVRAIIYRLVASHARKSGADADDLAQDIRLQIAERAAQDPAYLDYDDVGIVVFALRRVIDRYRSRRAMSRRSIAYGDEWQAGCTVARRLN